MAGRPPKADVWPAEKRPRGAWLRSHGRVARESLSYASRRFAASLLVWTLIGIALALPAALFLLLQNLGAAGGEWRGTVGFTVYFEIGGDDADVEALATRLRAEPEIEAARVVDPAAALAEFRALAGMENALDLLDDNPLPATIRAVARADAPPSRIARLAGQAERSAGVDEVEVEVPWLERLAAIRDVAAAAAWTFVALLAPATMLVCAIGVRLAIESRLQEVRVLILLGARRGFLRRPFLYLGTIYGIGGALLAAMFVSAALLALEAPLARLSNSYGTDLELRGFDPIFVVVLLACGAVLGNLGALLASRSRLREPAST